MQQDSDVATELVLHIGNATTNAWRDGDIIAASRTYDALRTHAEVIIRGRGSVRDAGHVATLRVAYDKLVNLTDHVMPDEPDLADWWVLCESLTGLVRSSFESFPYTTRERSLFLVVPLDREATVADLNDWVRNRRPLPKPVGDELVSKELPKARYVDWVNDVLPAGNPRTVVHSHLGTSFAASETDIRNQRVAIKVVLPVADTVIRERP